MAFTNACLNWVNASLTLRVKKPVSVFSVLDLGKLWFLDFTKILDLSFLPEFFFIGLVASLLPTILLSTTLLPPTLPSVFLGFATDPVLPIVFNIEVSGAAIQQNP